MLRILVLICCFVFIGGCSIHQPYPESWETKNINKNCFWLNGSFKNVGEYIIDGQVYTSYLSGYFLKDKRLDGSQISLVTFQINDEQNFIVVNALSDSQVNEKAIKFECIEGVIVSELNVDVTGGEAGALVLGVKTERIKLAESIKGLRDPHKLLPHIIHTLSDRPVSSTTELSTAKFALALADNIAYLY